MKLTIEVEVSEEEKAALAKDHGDEEWSWEDVEQWCRNSLESYLSDYAEPNEYNACPGDIAARDAF